MVSYFAHLPQVSAKDMLLNLEREYLGTTVYGKYKLPP